MCHRWRLPQRTEEIVSHFYTEAQKTWVPAAALRAGMSEVG
jgi:hypothetical protein